MLFADVVLLASSSQELRRALEPLVAECEAAAMKVSSSKSEAMVPNQKKVKRSFWVGSPYLRRKSLSTWVSC